VRFRQVGVEVLVRKLKRAYLLRSLADAQDDLSTTHEKVHLCCAECFLGRTCLAH
jgi:hypothetical protein